MKPAYLVLCLVAVVLGSAQAFFPVQHFEPHYGHKLKHQNSSVIKVTESSLAASGSENGDAMIYNFSIPKNKPLETCFQVEMSFSIDIDYLKTNETNKSTQTFELGDINDYTGECNSTINTLMIVWRDSWTLRFNFTLVDKTYQLDAISLNYIIDDKFFPNVSNSQKGNQMITASNLGIFSTLKDNSFKCHSQTKIVADDKQAVMLINNYHGQPFMSGDNNGKPREFGAAVECIGDKLNANKLVPIIVGSVLFALILVIIVSYIVCRRKHRSTPGYQQV